MSKKKVYILAIIAMAAATIVEALFAEPHHHNLWDVTPGFDILFGLIGCAALIVLAKIIIGPIIQKDEDYYEGGEDE